MNTNNSMTPMSNSEFHLQYSISHNPPENKPHAPKSRPSLDHQFANLVCEFQAPCFGISILVPA